MRKQVYDEKIGVVEGGDDSYSQSESFSTLNRSVNHLTYHSRIGHRIEATTITITATNDGFASLLFPLCFTYLSPLYLPIYILLTFGQFITLLFCWLCCSPSVSFDDAYLWNKKILLFSSNPHRFKECVCVFWQDRFVSSDQNDNVNNNNKNKQNVLCKGVQVYL